MEYRPSIRVTPSLAQKSFPDFFVKFQRLSSEAIRPRLTSKADLRLDVEKNNQIGFEARSRTEI